MRAFAASFHLILAILLHGEVGYLTDKGTEASRSDVQMVTDLIVGLYDGAKQCVFARACTLSFEVCSFGGLAIGSKIFSCDVGQQP